MSEEDYAYTPEAPPPPSPPEIDPVETVPEAATYVDPSIAASTYVEPADEQYPVIPQDLAPEQLDPEAEATSAGNDPEPPDTTAPTANEEPTPAQEEAHEDLIDPRAEQTSVEDPPPTDSHDDLDAGATRDAEERTEEARDDAADAATQAATVRDEEAREDLTDSTVQPEEPREELVDPQAEATSPPEEPDTSSAPVTNETEDPTPVATTPVDDPTDAGPQPEDPREDLLDPRAEMTSLPDEPDPAPAPIANEIEDAVPPAAAPTDDAGDDLATQVADARDELVDPRAELTSLPADDPTVAAHDDEVRADTALQAKEADEALQTKETEELRFENQTPPVSDPRDELLDPRAELTSVPAEDPTAVAHDEEVRTETALQTKEADETRLEHQTQELHDQNARADAALQARAAEELRFESETPPVSDPRDELLDPRAESTSVPAEDPTLAAHEEVRIDTALQEKQAEAARFDPQLEESGAARPQDAPEPAPPTNAATEAWTPATTGVDAPTEKELMLGAFNELTHEPGEPPVTTPGGAQPPENPSTDPSGTRPPADLDAALLAHYSAENAWQTWEKPPESFAEGSPSVFAHENSLATFRETVTEVARSIGLSPDDPQVTAMESHLQGVREFLLGHDNAVTPKNVGTPGWHSDIDLTFKDVIRAADIGDGTLDNSKIRDHARSLALSSVDAVVTANAHVERLGLSGEQLDANNYTHLHESAFRGADADEAGRIRDHQSVVSLASLRASMDDPAWERFTSSALDALGTKGASTAELDVQDAAHATLARQFSMAENMAEEVRDAKGDPDQLAALWSRNATELKTVLNNTKASDFDIRSAMAAVKLAEPGGYAATEAKMFVVDHQQELKSMTPAGLVPPEAKQANWDSYGLRPMALEHQRVEPLLGADAALREAHPELMRRSDDPDQSHLTVDASTHLAETSQEMVSVLAMMHEHAQEGDGGEASWVASQAKNLLRIYEAATYAGQVIPDGSIATSQSSLEMLRDNKSNPDVVARILGEWNLDAATFVDRCLGEAQRLTSHTMQLSATRGA